MTKFIYISDTHFGANPMNYHQQEGYPEKLPEIILKLNEFIKNRDDIDFVLHGGDMIDSVSEQTISMASKYFKFDVPIYLCLGNHDLTELNSLDLWLKIAPQYFNDTNKPIFTITTKDCLIHVIPNHWEEIPYYWSETQEAYLSEEQINNLSHELNKSTDFPHIVLTHSPIFGLPTEQTGQEEIYHSPNENFRKTLTSLAQNHKTIKCILGGHNHLNMNLKHENVQYVTASSFSEAPFDFKLFEVSKNSITMETINLADSLDFNIEYNSEKSYVQGRPIDRKFAINFDL
ncbi:MAG: metallophosphoesterase [Pseudomonadales bacterium]|nr:metallophosphoesterase [Pseudomonadales bacterium]PCJ62261.1 MAG: hypothetical protein COA79_04150 [Planctomycetota bacterium]